MVPNMSCFKIYFYFFKLAFLADHIIIIMKLRFLSCLLLLVCHNHFSQNNIDTLKIGIYHSPPFVIYEEDDKISGVSPWLWRSINAEIQQPYQFIRYNDEQPLRDILMDLETGSIDLSINPLTLTSSRQQRVNFTYPFYTGNLTVVAKKDSKFDFFSKIVVAIFSHHVLYLIVILAFLVVFFGVLIWVVERKNHHFERGFQGLLSSFWWSAVTMTTVGYGDKVPISNLGRFIALFWMLCSLITISIFSASITSNLTVHKLASNNNSIKDYKRNRVGTVSGSAAEEYLQRNFFMNVQSTQEFIKGLEGLHTGDQEIFVYDEPWIRYQLQNNPKFESLEILPIEFEVQLYAMPMNKKMPQSIQDRITASLMKLRESHDWRLLKEEYQLKEY